jgi:hypothetical protein
VRGQQEGGNQLLVVFFVFFVGGVVRVAYTRHDFSKHDAYLRIRSLVYSRSYLSLINKRTQNATVASITAKRSAYARP